MSIKNIQDEIAKDKDYFYLCNKTINYTRDPRFQDLDLKDAHYNGSVYNRKRRPYDWDGAPIPLYSQGTNVNRAFPDEKPPTSMRRPHAPVYMSRIVNNRFASLLFGEHRFPYFKVAHSINTEVYLNTLMTQIEMKANMTEAATLGGSMGSVIVMFVVRDGEFEIECFNTKWCMPIWDHFHKGVMKGFSVVYPQVVEEYDPETHTFAPKRYLYRRVITKNADIVFKLMPLKSQTDETSMVLKDSKQRPEIDEDKSTYHGFGFVPAVFIQNLPRYDQIDGDSNAECAYDLFDRMNETLSGVNSALQANLDPTLLLNIAVEDYKQLQASGGIVGTGATGEAIIVGEKGGGKFLEIQGTAIEKAIDTWFKMRQAGLETCDCVIPDPEKISGVGQSGSAVAKLFEPMIGKADKLRTQYGERGLKRLAVLMLQAREKLTTAAPTEDGMKRGVFKPLYRTITEESASGEKVVRSEVVEPDPGILSSQIQLKWGRYFQPTADDVFKIAQAGTMATGKPTTTTAVAAAYSAEFFDDHDPLTTIATLKKQEDDARKHELDLAERGMKAKKASSGVANPNAKKS